MKKIGVLTFFYADNYGALLQCYALSKFCEQYDYDVKVIGYHSKQMFTWKYRLKRRVAKTKQNRRLDCNRKTFYSVGKIKEFYDIVIVGSDQVWNPSIINGDIFWIEPEWNYNKLISYAASIGKDFLSHDEKKFFEKRNFSAYNCISVREKTGQRILDKIGVKAEVVCDPTLLFYDTPEIYDNIIRKSKLNINNYAYVYSLEYSNSIDEISKKMSKNGYKIISSHPANAKVQYCDEIVKDSDISDFLYLIKNASIIITNSFHGLAFSLIFKKNVYIICHSKLASRQTDLINESGLDYDDLGNGVYRIYSYTNDGKLKNYIEKSKKFLCSQLRNE